MKKLAIMLAAVVLSLSLVACGSRGNNGNNGGSTNNGTARSGNDGFMGSRSYDQMLRDGRVHDTDGDLTDGENSVSDW